MTTDKKNLTLFGLKTCDTCRKARRALESAGYTVAYVDIREEADLDKKVPLWLRAAPDAVINKASATWRSLSVAEKARAATNPKALLLTNPTLVKRPVIEMADATFVGWTRDVQAQLISTVALREA
jgi:arsenate reductase (glutaredoxin)